MAAYKNNETDAQKDCTCVSLQTGKPDGRAGSDVALAHIKKYGAAPHARCMNLFGVYHESSVNARRISSIFSVGKQACIAHQVWQNKYPRVFCPCSRRIRPFSLTVIAVYSAGHKKQPKYSKFRLFFIRKHPGEDSNLRSTA